MKLDVEEVKLVMTEERILRLSRKERNELKQMVLELKISRFYYKATRFWSKEPTMINFDYVDTEEDIQNSTIEDDFLFVVRVRGY